MRGLRVLSSPPFDEPEVTGPGALPGPDDKLGGLTPPIFYWLNKLFSIPRVSSEAITDISAWKSFHEGSLFQRTD